MRKVKVSWASLETVLKKQGILFDGKQAEEIREITLVKPKTLSILVEEPPRKEESNA